MSVQEIVAHGVGAALVLGAAAWLYVDVKPDGHVALSTAIGVGVLGLAGGFLIDKAGVGEFVDFVIAKWQAFRNANGGVV